VFVSPEALLPSGAWLRAKEIPAFLTNIRLGYKGSKGTNALAFLFHQWQRKISYKFETKLS
jgi:hypothetical protein